MVFPLIYSVSFFERMKFISTERIALFILLVYAFSVRNKKIENSAAKSNVLGMCMLQAFLLVYACFVLSVFGMGTGTNILTYIVNFLIIVPLEIYCLINLFDSNDELMRVLFIVSIIQVLVITGTLVDPVFANFIDSTFNSVNSYFDYQYMRKIWYPGGISCITSTGALKLSLGVVSGMYLYQKSNRNVVYLILTLFIIAISTIVARTGLFIGVVAIVLLLLNLSKKGSVFVILGASFFISVVCVIVYFSVVNESGLQFLFKRLIVLSENGLYNAFFKGYFSSQTTVIPDLSWKTIVGTGIVSGESGNDVIVNADGGFVRMYSSIGLPLALFFYFFLFYKMFLSARLTQTNSVVHYSTLLMFAIMIIGEFKEPFFYTRYLFILFYLVVYFYERDNGYLRCNGCLTKF